jgi:hypothetical protein
MLLLLRGMNVMSRRARLLGLLLFTCVLSACGEPPTIHVEGKIPPTFSFTGSRFAEYRHLHFFIVVELGSGNEKLPSDAGAPNIDKTLWQIWPDASEKGDVENLPAVTYGSVPVGWTQKIPDQGGPSPLVEGKVYEAGGPQIDSHKAYMRFTIRGGKVVRLPLYRDEFDKEASVGR